MLFMLIYVISSIFQMYEFYLFIRCFFNDCKVSWRGELLAYVGLFIVLTVPYIWLGIPAVTTICSYLGEIAITFIYRGSIKRKILSGTFLFATMALSECVVAVIFGFVNHDLFATTEYYSMFANVCLPIVQFMIVLFVKNMKNIQEGEKIPLSYWIISLALPIFSVYLFLLFCRQPHINSVEMVCCTVLLFLTNIFVFYLYDHQIEILRVRQEKETLELQNEYQENQLKMMHQAVEQSKSQRHDFLKHISMISHLNDHNQPEEIKTYLEEIQTHIASEHKYVNSGNFVIDSILNYKIQEGLSEKIKISHHIKVPAELILSIYDLNVVLTNLLDNSILAVRDMDDKRIDIDITYQKGGLRIYIRNPYREVKKNSVGEYLTTKADAGMHGYGLKNVRKLVESRGGIMSVKDENQVFEVVVFIPVSKVKP